MNRLPDSINQQFNQLFAVIGQASDDLKLAIAEAGLVGNFEAASANMVYCQRLQVLENELKACLERFGYANKTALIEKNTHHRSKRRTRKPNGLIRVRVAGKVIQEPTINKSFVEVLKIFGLERVARLNKTVTSIPLLARQPANGYQAQTPCNGWYITTHVNRAIAANLLQEIGNELNMPVKIDFLDR